MKAPRCSFYFDLISKRKKGVIASILRGILYLLSLLYSCAVFLRKKVIKHSYSPKAFTISVGNIVAGGTGKTPFVIYLAKQFEDVGILMRGYKGAIEKTDDIYCFQKEAPAALVGDEAALIARNVPHATLFCGKNKALAAKRADEKGIKLLIVDDGLQHLRLTPNFHIIMLDSLNPFGYGHLLPRGLLREPVSALKRADLIVVTCRNGVDIPPSIEALVKEQASCPIAKVRFKAVGLFDVSGKEAPPCQKVAIFCAIAKPDQFVGSVAALGCEIVDTHFFDDHQTLLPSVLQQLARTASSKGAEALICTEKDMVKLDPSISLTMPIYFLKVEVEPMTENLLDLIPLPDFSSTGTGG